jgi:hypothetical protein
LISLPAQALSHDVWTALFGGEQLFLKLMSASCTMRQTEPYLVTKPRSRSSATKPRKVRSGSASRCAISQSRSSDNECGRLPPIGYAAALPVARNCCDHFTTLATLTLKVAATFRQLSPAKTAATTRSRRSRD